MKNVLNRSFSGPYFPAFGPENSEYGHFLRNEKHLKVNSDKYHLLLSLGTPTEVPIDVASFKSSKIERLQGIAIGSNLVFDIHLSSIFIKVSK